MSPARWWRLWRLSRRPLPIVIRCDDTQAHLALAARIELAERRAKRAERHNPSARPRKVHTL